MGKQTKLSLILLVLLLVPAFSLMLRTGLFTTHDFHIFRQYEFHQCLKSGFFPCSWSPDAGMGYGEPMFLFYGQFPYWIGEIFITLGFSIISSVKILFILSFLLSGIFMYFLARDYWGNIGGLVSALFYVYAPYRSVDVWVRGALPEASAYVLFPVILLVADRLIAKPALKWVLTLGFTLAVLINTHNLSAFMFLPFLGLWVASRRFRAWPQFVLAGIISLLLSAFYLLPVILESRLITITQITQGYYQYGIHFTTLYRLFVSNFWGYGASVWGPTQYLSFSAGYLQWIVPLIIALVLVFRRQFRSPFWLFVLLGSLALFLTHGKSNFIWRHVPGLPYVQFPWRFLSMSTLFLSLSAGAFVTIFTRKIIYPVLLVALLIINAPNFRPDIWKPFTDSQYFSGVSWTNLKAVVLADFWPAQAPTMPSSYAPDQPVLDSGSAIILRAQKSGQLASYTFQVTSDTAKISLPIVDFPGWQIFDSGHSVPFKSFGNLGLLTLDLNRGIHSLNLKFVDTWPRMIGDVISLVTLIGLLIVLVRTEYAKK